MLPRGEAFKPMARDGSDPLERAQDHADRDCAGRVVAANLIRKNMSAVSARGIRSGRLMSLQL